MTRLQLQEFVLTNLNVKWHEPPTSREAKMAFRFGYDVARHKSDKRRFRLQFTVRAEPADKKVPVGYEIESTIVGLFEFVDGMSEGEMQALIRINGGTILYGILRGQIAAFTGSFPGGKFSLPTVMMHEIVEQIEASRAVKKSAGQATGLMAYRGPSAKA